MEKLIKQAKRGDEHAFAKLFQEYYPLLVKYLLKITMNPDTAEELSQETMAKVIEKIHLFNEKSKFSSWLISIATNLYIDLVRKKSREKSWQQGEQIYRKLKWYMESQNEEWSDVLTALGKLSSEFRIPIILKHYYGYSYDEIGKMMKIPSGTIKSRVHNGINTVRKELKLDGEAENDPKNK
ncbi:RNA polymerase sigma factor SigY [Bacillus aquiflavi]|uniref:RNA polymerase sigma factor SigY n=1 Tax=Bacillus aquiflavi TaxID=2672567 RepID=A0A6B3VWX0_9BACI|nr:RNA polymerase sigma factor SigY [Bacillus aquiflavi]MBA4535630.1 RNA polymerase sigma factor SigY [Bacillus aquiflavi]NEY80006.1 RNA polymerase sigma factor SigY [Bacillus aquiflavi]UAC49947.1 RNA polymerase sigma factor SigY [Bacillus aquiflavi]